MGIGIRVVMGLGIETGVGARWRGREMPTRPASTGGARSETRPPPIQGPQKSQYALTKVKGVKGDRAQSWTQPGPGHKAPPPRTPQIVHIRLGV